MCCALWLPQLTAQYAIASMHSHLVRTCCIITPIYSPTFLTRGFLCSPACSKLVLERDINAHLDSNCSDEPRPTSTFSSTQRGGKMAQASLTSLFTPSGKSQHAYYAQSSSSKSGLTRKRSQVEDAAPADTTPLKRPRVTASSRLQSAAPLAERLRPRSLDEFVGQPHLTEPGSLLMSHLDRGATGSIVFWGPPGCVRLSYVLAICTSRDPCADRMLFIVAERPHWHGCSRNAPMPSSKNSALRTPASPKFVQSSKKLRVFWRSQAGNHPHVLQPWL